MSISLIDSSYYDSTYYSLLESLTTSTDDTTDTTTTTDADSTTESTSSTTLADMLLEDSDSDSYWSSDSDTSYFSGAAMELASLQIQSAYSSTSSLTTTTSTSSLAYLESLATSAAEDLGLDSVTFQDLMTHKDYLMDEFTATVSAGLEEAGVASDADFRLTIGDDGTITVQSNHEDADTIQAYFDANPDLAEDFIHIDALDQIEQARLTNNYNLSSLYSQGMQMSISSSLSSGYTSQATTMAFTDGGSSMSLLQISGISTVA